MRKVTAEVREKDLNPYNKMWFIYGPPKIGKSTLCSKIPDNYFIHTEKGHHSLEAPGDECYTWQDFLELKADLVANHKDKFKMVTIDTTLNLYTACCVWVCKKNRVEHISDLKYARGYDQVHFAFRSAVMDLLNAGFGVIFVSHEFIKDSSFDGMDRSQIQIDLPGNARKTVIPISNIIARVFIQKTMGPGGKMVDARYLQAKADPNMESGDQTGILEAVGKVCIDPVDDCWKNVEAHFIKAMEG